MAGGLPAAHCTARSALVAVTGGVQQGCTRGGYTPDPVPSDLTVLGYLVLGPRVLGPGPRTRPWTRTRTWSSYSSLDSYSDLVLVLVPGLVLGPGPRYSSLDSYSDQY